ncbi:hypothetical protein ACHAXS_006989 [Conticribra weissflogii]
MNSMRSSVVEKAEQGYMQKIIDLDSIENEDLRNALAPFDKSGGGTIDLGLVRQAAEGKTSRQVVRKEYLEKVHKVNKGLTAYCNAGKTYTNVKGKLGTMDVWLNTMAIANILSFTELEKKYKITYDTTGTDGQFVVHTPSGEVRFKRNDLGLPYISLKDDKTAVCLVNTIRGNSQGYTKRQIKRAEEARRAMSMVGGPTENEFTQMTSQGSEGKQQEENPKSTSVPAGADTGTMNTNANNNMNSDKIVNQYFIRDPDGYYLEICNCDETLTKYCFGEKDTLPGYEEGIEPLSLAAASSTLNLMRRWMTKLDTRTDRMEVLSKKVKETDGSIKAVAALVGSKRAETVNEKDLSTLLDRRSIYGDVCQNEEEKDMEEILLEAGNSSQVAETIIKLRSAYRGKTIYRPSAVFHADGTKYMPKAIERLH